MKRILLFLMLSGIAFAAGCSAIPYIGTGVSGVLIWKDGEAKKYYNEELEVVYRAVKASLKDLDHRTVKDEPYRGGGRYIVAGDKDKFKIVVRQVKPNITEVKIRINFMGDKPYAELVYRQIDTNTNTINYGSDGKPTKLSN